MEGRLDLLVWSHSQGLALADCNAQEIAEGQE
jgi:hypothetical protein